MTKSSGKYRDIVQNNGLLKPLLAIPVFYRVLIANSLIIFVGATGGTD